MPIEKLRVVQMRSDLRLFRDCRSGRTEISRASSEKFRKRVDMGHGTAELERRELAAR